MALLVVGLVAAGIGTMAFLRNALIVSLDEQLVQLTSTDVAVNALIQTEAAGSVVKFSVNRMPRPTTSSRSTAPRATGDHGGGDEDADHPASPTP